MRRDRRDHLWTLQSCWRIDCLPVLVLMASWLTRLTLCLVLLTDQCNRSPVGIWLASARAGWLLPTWKRLQTMIPSSCRHAEASARLSGMCCYYDMWEAASHFAVFQICELQKLPSSSPVMRLQQHLWLDESLWGTIIHQKCRRKPCRITFCRLLALR